MNQVFSTSTEDYHPISFGDTYLYENYKRVLAFLKPRLNRNEINRFSKPLHSEGLINWHSVYTGPMKRLNTYSKDYQIDVEQEYVSFLSSIKKIINELITSGDKEKLAWAELIQEVFKTEDNLLISNGSDWVLLWGWKFRNKLNFVTPSFQNQNQDNEDENEASLESSFLDQEQVIRDDGEVQLETRTIHKDIDSRIEVQQEKTSTNQPKRMSFWERLKRFFRKISFRFWGLLLLIVLFLILLCLLRTCSNHQNKKNLNQFEQDLNNIEYKLEERCADQYESES